MRKRRKTKSRKSIDRKRSLAAKKGWVTRRRHERERKKEIEEQKTTAYTIEHLLGFVDKAEIPDERQQAVETLINRYYGVKGYNFDFDGAVLKISISTTKTRKKFSVRR